MDEKELVEESERTKKAREKLKRKLDDLEKRISPHSLEKKIEEIHQWISRNQEHRVRLKKDSFSLFDENKSSADLSTRLQNLFHNLSESNEDLSP